MKNKGNILRIKPTVDVCFRRLLENAKVRMGFVAALLGREPEEIEETVLQPTYLPVDSLEDKLGILDIHLKLKDGTRMNIEMQVEPYPHWDERALFYLSKIFTRQLKKGQDYEHLKKCIHVSILNFIRFPEDGDYYRKIHFREERNGKLYTDKLELQILELKKLPKEIGEENKIAAWMRFFNSETREELERMAKTDEYLKEACETVLEFDADEIQWYRNLAREKAIRDYHSFLNAAKKEGEEQGVQLAKRVFMLHLQGIADKEIAAECGIDEDKVRRILE